VKERKKMEERETNTHVFTGKRIEREKQNP